MPLKFSQINKNDNLFEGRNNTPVKVLTQPKKNGNQWTFIGLIDGKEVEYLQTEGQCSYGPSLYEYPAYVGYN